MNERQLEIMVRRCPEAVFGAGFELVAQQLSLPSGRIDLLLKDATGTRHVVELKKGRATRAALQQVLAYSHDLSVEAGVLVIPWVVAHEIPPAVESEANSQNVRVLAVSIDACYALCEEFGIVESDLIGSRKGSVISGGGSKWGLRSLVDNEEVFSVLPLDVTSALRQLTHTKHVDVVSGGMQTVVFYRCCKVGGYNRQHRGGHFYVANGVVIQSELAEKLSGLGFLRRSKVQSGSSHEHVWWEIGGRQAEAFKSAVDACFQVIDDALGETRHRV